MQRCTTGNIAHRCGWKANIVQGAVKCFACLETTPMCTISRGSHIHITCRSVCDRDQNGIKLLTFFFGANQGIKMNSERLISTDQHIFLDSTEAWLRFVLWIPVKSSDWEPRNGTIKQSRTISTDQDSWSRLQTLLQVMRMWPSLAISHSARVKVVLKKWKSVPVGGALLPNVALLHLPKK